MNREIKQLVQGLTASKCQSQNSNPVDLIAESSSSICETASQKPCR